MLDFNTKREILRNLRSKRNKNKLLWLPCVIAELFVKLWYAVVCSIDMALSDKEGNFLGLKMRKSAKAKSRKKDDIVHVKKPFLGRVLSAVLAFSFVFMMVPELGMLEMRTYAANEVATQDFEHDGVWYSAVPGMTGYYYKFEDYFDALSITVPSVTATLAYQSAKIEWEPPAGHTGISDITYTVGYKKNNASKRVEEGVSETEYIFDSKVLIETGVNYSFFVIPTTKLYCYTWVEKKSATVVDGETVIETKQVFEQTNTLGVVEGIATETIDSGKVDKYIENPPTPEWKLTDSSVILSWSHSATDNTTSHNLPYGYMVYRASWNSKNAKYDDYELVEGSPFEAGRYLNRDTNEIVFSDNNIMGGSQYIYFVVAYRDLFGGTEYKKGKAGIIQSEDEFGNPNKTEPILIPPSRVSEMSVVSNRKDTLTVTWKDPVNSNVDDYLLYRSEIDFTEEYINQFVVTDENGDPVKDANGKTICKYWDEENRTYDYFTFINDMINEGKAGKLEINDKKNNRHNDTYDPIENKIANDKTYYYYLIPYVNADKSGIKKLYGPMKSASGAINAALQPPQLDVPVTEDGKVTLKWKEVPNADGYTIYIFKEKHYNNSNKGLGSLGTIDVGKVTTYTFDGLLNGDTYTYQVQAYTNVETSASDNLKSPWSNPRTITVGETLGIPQDVKVTTKDGQNTITWSGVDGAEGYYLYYRCNGGSLKHFDLTKESFTHTGLQNGDFYEYYVVAYKVIDKSYDPNQGGKEQIVKSEPSVTVTIVVGDTLDAPKDFAVTTEDGVAHLSWTKVNGAEGYIIEASGSGHGVKEIDVSKEKYDHIDLENGDSWTYRVRAYKTVNGKRDYSVYTRSITVVIGISLNAPLDLTATAGNRQIDLSWTAVKGAEGYIVYLYDDFTMEYEPLTVTSKTTYSHVGLKNGKGYTYMVAAFKTSNGERHIGEYSMAVTAIPTTGSITDIDHTLNIKGTTPYGISHSEYISAKTNHDAFSESVDVYITTNQESTKAVKDVLKHYANGLSSFIIYPFDISVYKENTLIKVDPEDGYTVTMTIPIPDKLIAYRDYLTVVHINENLVENIEETEWYEIQDQRLEVLPCAILEIDNVWCVQFVCSNFSPYAFVIYKEHINDVSSGGGVMDGSFAGTFNSGMLLLTSLPDILPNNKKLTVVESKKRYRIKKVTRK